MTIITHKTYEINMQVAHAHCSSGWYLASRARTLMQLGGSYAQDNYHCQSQLHNQIVQPEVLNLPVFAIRPSA